MANTTDIILGHNGDNEVVLRIEAQPHMASFKFIIGNNELTINDSQLIEMLKQDYVRSWYQFANKLQTHCPETESWVDPVV